MIWPKEKHLLHENSHHTGFRPWSPRFDFCDRHHPPLNRDFLALYTMLVLCAHHYSIMVLYLITPMYFSCLGEANCDTVNSCYYTYVMLIQAAAAHHLLQEQKYRTLQRSVASFTTFSEMN